MDNQEALESVKSAHIIYNKLKLTAGIAETKITEAEIMLATGSDRKKAINLLVGANKTFEKEGLEAMRKEGESLLRKIGRER